MNHIQFNDKYHLLRHDINPNSLFASFKVFKVIRNSKTYRIDERPPYPILIDNPTVGETLKNINKSDVFLGLTFVAGGLVSSILGSRYLLRLSNKFYFTKYTMWWYNLCGIFVAMNCSYLRLTGYLENGLRWKQNDSLYTKYDFTSDFERNTIFKHLRERID